MKRIHALILCVVLVCTNALYAQEPQVPLSVSNKAKPFLFAQLPDSFEVSYPELQKLISTEVEEAFSLQLSSQFLINGKIVNKTQQNSGTISINARIANYNNALFNISISLLADNSSNIQGRIIQPKFNDVLILYKEKL
ncbi:MAG: hypothetical protein ABI480_18285 [Chitinophagaceae bacterium]